MLLNAAEWSWKERADQHLLNLALHVKVIADFGEKHLRRGGEGRENSLCRFGTWEGGEEIESACMKNSKKFGGGEKYMGTLREDVCLEWQLLIYWYTKVWFLEVISYLPLFCPGPSCQIFQVPLQCLLRFVQVSQSDYSKCSLILAELHHQSFPPYAFCSYCCL